MVERDRLSARVHSLEEQHSELRVAADRSGHYQQITSEMEERVSVLEKELLMTAQKVGSLEKQLKRSEAQLMKEQTRCEKLDKRIRQLTALEHELRQQPPSHGTESLLAELETKQSELYRTQNDLRKCSSDLEKEQLEKVSTRPCTGSNTVATVVSR